jgi:SAM-dependent methyltransferase
VRRNFCPTVLDGSEVLLKTAREKFGDKIRTIHALFEDFSTSEKYDIIIATHVLEHVDEPVALLRHLKQFLSENGRIIIIVPNKNSIHRRLAVSMNLQPTLDTLSARDLLVGHQRVYDFDSLEIDIRCADLEVESRAGFFLKVLPNSMMVKYSKDLIRALNTISSDVEPDLLANIGLVAVRKSSDFV